MAALWRRVALCALVCVLAQSQEIRSVGNSAVLLESSATAKVAAAEKPAATKTVATAAAAKTEEKPAATKTAAAPVAKTEEKPAATKTAAAPATAAKTEEKPAAPATAAKTEEKPAAEKPAAPATAAKTEEKPEAKSVFHRLYLTGEAYIHNPEYQMAAALISLVLGAVLLCNGEIVFKYVVLSGLGFFYFSTAMVSAETFYPHWDTIFCQVWGLEAAVLATAFGFLAWHAMRVLLGAAVGVVCAKSFLAEIASLNPLMTSATMPALCVGVWTVFVFLGAWLMQSNHHKKLIRLVSPAIGSALFVASCSYFLTWAAVRGPLKGDLGSLTPSCGQDDPKCSWLTFWYMIVSNTSEDVGLFVGSGVNPDIKGAPYMNQLLCLDRMFERLWWTLSFLISYRIQKKIAARRDAAEESSAAGTKAMAASIEEDMEQPTK